MRRRRFLKLGALGAAGALASPMERSLGATTDTSFSLTIAPANVEMIDGTHVYMLLYFRDNSEAGAVLRVSEGQPISFEVTNSDSQPHGFAITGIPQATIPAIAPGAVATVTFTAPEGGSYLYHDPYNAPLNRVIGLHGAFIVIPTEGTTPVGSPTPFSRSAQTPQVQSLFDALGGGHPRFPGSKWNADDPDRQKIWLFMQTDPTLNAAVAAGGTVAGSSVVGTFVPRYFTINGRSGFDTAVHSGSAGQGHEAARLIMPSGRQGQPCLIRSMNAGLATHSPHIHGNHVMMCTETDAYGVSHCETHAYERDAWLLKPLSRIDVLLPFERPPDIPAASWPPREEPFPLRYVMHCHTEMSQTAGGGNYPQGCVTHWEMTGPL
jgi:FtsP/CotA-like multicopper oxidase with cupredoxin domain